MSIARLPYADWHEGELWAALRSLFSRGGLADDEVADLKLRLEAIFGGSVVLPVNAGRTALKLALRAMQRLRSDATKVILPAYICPSVPAAVVEIGLQPVFVDVGADFNMAPESAAQEIGRDTLAVVAVHMYGYPAAAGEFEKICTDRGVYLIDDAAQVAGVSVDNRPLGSFGDVGILSFAQSKTIVTGQSGCGGALIIKNFDIRNIVESQFYALLPAKNIFRDLIRFAAFNVLYDDKLNLEYYFNRVVKTIFQRRSPQLAVPESRISKAHAAIAIRQIVSLERRLQARKVMQREFQKVARRYGLFEFPQYCSCAYLTRAMALFPSGTDVELFRKKLRIAGVPTRLGYPFPAKIDPSKYPQAHRLSNLLLELPSNNSLSVRDMEIICEKISACN